MKQKVLAVFPQLPLPEYGGDCLKVNNLIKILSQQYCLDAIIISRNKPTAEDIHFLKKYCNSFRIFKIGLVGSLCFTLLFLLRGKPLQIGYYYRPSIKHYIRKRFNNYDFLFCNLIRTAMYIEQSTKPKFIDMVDVISSNYEHSKQKVYSFLWKWIYEYEHKKLRTYELFISNQFQATFLVNHIEQQKLQALVTKPVIWLPNGIKDFLFQYNKFDEAFEHNAIAFIGKLNYQPNIDALLWFIQNVWPYLSCNIHFYIIGPKPSRKLKSVAASHKNRIHLLGYVKDPYVILHSCNCVVSPMQTGGGIQNKILEAMALGKINVTTTLAGNSIYKALNYKHYLAEDNAEKMATLINNIIAHPEKYECIGKNAKELASEIYTWKNFGQILITTIQANLHS